MVEYDPGDGKHVRNVHTKQVRSEEERGRIEARKAVSFLASDGRRNLPAINIGRSLGAKAKNYNVLDPDTGEYFQFAEGTKIQNV